MYKKQFDNLIDIDSKSIENTINFFHSVLFTQVYPTAYYMTNNMNQSTLFNLSYDSKGILKTILQKYNIDLNSTGCTDLLFFGEDIYNKIVFPIIISQKEKFKIETQHNNLMYFSDRMIEDDAISGNHIDLINAKDGNINIFNSGELFIKVFFQNKDNKQSFFYIARIFNDINNAVSIMYDKYTTYICCKKDDIKDIANIIYNSFTEYFNKGIFEYDLMSDSNIELDTTILNNYVITDKIKELYDDIENFINSKSFYIDNKFPYKRGALLAGSPGNGKSLTLSYIKQTFKIPIIFCQNPDVYIIKKCFYNANMIYKFTNKPCVLFIEEVDSILSAPGGREMMLGLLDGIKKNVGIYTILTTNNPQNFDAAILNRPSRIDTIIEVPPPNVLETKQYFKMFFNEWTDNQIEMLSKKCVKHKFSFAFLYDFYILYRDKNYDEQKIEKILEQKIKHIKEDESTLYNKIHNKTDEFGF